MILAMIAWQQRDGDPAWSGRIRKTAHGVMDLAFKKGDYAYYPDGKGAFDFPYLKDFG
jgi:hypothetical protein